GTRGVGVRARRRWPVRVLRPVARGPGDRRADDAGVDVERLAEGIDHQVALELALDLHDQARRVLECAGPRVGVRPRLAPHLETEELDATDRAIDRFAELLGTARR